MLRVLILLISLLATAYTKTPKFNPPNIHGTWQTQSQSVMTGPSFFQPDTEYLIEPHEPGLSYSFDLQTMTYETAQYLVYGNAQNHSCPSAQLIWHHGKLKIKPHLKKGYGKNGIDENEHQLIIFLESIDHDSRQLVSDPCLDEGNSTYQRYKGNTKEVWSGIYKYDAYVDKWSLILYDEFGGTGRKVWMWLKSRDVEMLPRGRVTKKKKVYVDA
ncbi:rot1 [Candida margitis]|uniref:rot1 n=1 Tax=Candida margitis TaxID=1775924 RepID=UPI002227C897|nr:rot1 [Candida margitis]KAI5962874.1 rot1 [Candida margitis]